MATAGTRSKSTVYLLDHTEPALSGSKLPTSLMVLRVFLHKHKEEKLPIKQATSETLSDVMEYWEKARIPTKHKQDCHKKLEKLFDEWRKLKKNKGRRTKTQIDNEKDFLAKMNQLFDIAHADAMQMTKNDEDREFLRDQRAERKGTMIGVDGKLAGI